MSVHAFEFKSLLTKRKKKKKKKKKEISEHSSFSGATNSVCTIKKVEDKWTITITTTTIKYCIDNTVQKVSLFAIHLFGSLSETCKNVQQHQLPQIIMLTQKLNESHSISLFRSLYSARYLFFSDKKNMCLPQCWQFEFAFLSAFARDTTKMHNSFKVSKQWISLISFRQMKKKNTHKYSFGCIIQSGAHRQIRNRVSRCQ